MIWLYRMDAIHKLGVNSYFGRIKINVFVDKNKFNSCFRDEFTDWYTGYFFQT